MRILWVGFNVSVEQVEHTSASTGRVGWENADVSGFPLSLQATMSHSPPAPESLPTPWSLAVLTVPLPLFAFALTLISSHQRREPAAATYPSLLYLLIIPLV